MTGATRGGVVGGDKGDLGLPSPDSGGEDGREHVRDTVAGLDGGFAGSGRVVAFPAERALDLGKESFFDVCAIVSSVRSMEYSGGVGGRSPQSSDENEVVCLSMIASQMVEN